MEAIIQTIKPDGEFKGNNVYTITLDNGTTGNAFAPQGSYKDKKFASGEAIGEKMSYEQNEKGNFKSVRLGDYTPQNNSGGYTPKANGSSYNDSKQTSIVRQSCLNRATDLVAAGKADIKAVLEMAEKFEDWVTRVDAAPESTAPANHMPRNEATPPMPPLEKVTADDLQPQSNDGLPF